MILSKTPIERMIQAACTAVRCRERALQTEDAETAQVLYRAANRYSQKVAVLAREVGR